MSVHNASAAGRWIASVPLEKTDPKGPPECARNALARLGPFKHKLQAEADQLGPWTAVYGREAVSEELAFERIWLLATSFNERELLSEGAPRTKDVIENLTKLERLSGELCRHLKSLDDFTRHRLQTAGSGIGDFSKFVDYPLMNEADVDGLPPPDEEILYPRQDGWVQRLDALSRYANATSCMFLMSKGIVNIDTADKGGNSNLYKTLYGTAKWNLVHQGWHVYEMFKPGEATGTEGGSFHLFLQDVFEYATGLEPEEHSKLTEWLKKVPPVNRRMHEITERRLALIDEAAEIESSNLGLDEMQRRLKSIADEEQALEKERYDLWPQLYPYSYPKKAARK